MAHAVFLAGFLAVLVAAAVVAGNAVADPPVAALRAHLVAHAHASPALLDNATTNDADEARIWRAIVPLALATSLLAAFVVFELRRRRRQRASASHHAAEHRTTSVLRDPDADAPIGNPPSGRRSYATGQLELVAAQAANVVAQLIHNPTERECPACGREFDSVLALCPFDGEELVPRGTTARAAGSNTDAVDAATAHMTCPQCRVVFELGHRNCPYDGSQLVRRHTPRDDGQEQSLVCPACGAIADGDSAYCAHDHTRLVSRGEGNETDLSSAPVLICTQCVREYPTGTTHCRACEAELTVLHGRTTTGRALPTDLVMSRICPDCNARYAEAVDFCTKDGTRVVAVN